MKCCSSTERTANYIISSEEEFDAYIGEVFAQLLHRATSQTRRFLRETGQWQDDIVHEKLAQRCGYELLERFIADARAEVPFRPLHLLDSYILRHFSKSDTYPRHRHVITPIARFVDGLFSTAVHSRDAMTAIFYHLYGLGQQEVIKLLGLGSVESQRVYKNYVRWRSTGWLSMVDGLGLRDCEIREMLEQKQWNPVGLHTEVQDLVDKLQSHYRKSEPAYYPCLTGSEWEDLYQQDTAFDYKGWHLPFCHSCFSHVCKLRQVCREPESPVDFYVYPLPKAGAIEPCLVG
jgi:hypothetical protein